MLVVVWMKCRKVIGKSKKDNLDKLEKCPICNAEKKFIREIEHSGGCGCS